VELATDAESVAVTDVQRAVTPHGLGAALAKLFPISFTGSNLAGACTATGVAVGDVLFGIAGLTDMGQMDSKFEAIVTVADQIQQTAAENLSAKNFVALVLPAVLIVKNDPDLANAAVRLEQQYRSLRAQGCS